MGKSTGSRGEQRCLGQERVEWRTGVWGGERKRRAKGTRAVRAGRKDTYLSQDSHRPKRETDVGRTLRIHPGDKELFQGYQYSLTINT